MICNDYRPVLFGTSRALIQTLGYQKFTLASRRHLHRGLALGPSGSYSAHGHQQSFSRPNRHCGNRDPVQYHFGEKAFVERFGLLSLRFCNRVFSKPIGTLRIPHFLGQF